jgi:hypothetical protein
MRSPKKIKVDAAALRDSIGAKQSVPAETGVR